MRKNISYNSSLLNILFFVQSLPENDKNGLKNWVNQTFYLRAHTHTRDIPFNKKQQISYCVQNGGHGEIRGPILESRQRNKKSALAPKVISGKKLKEWDFIKTTEINHRVSIKLGRNHGRISISVLIKETRYWFDHLSW